MSTGVISHILFDISLIWHAKTITASSTHPPPCSVCFAVTTVISQISAKSLWSVNGKHWTLCGDICSWVAFKCRLKKCDVHITLEWWQWVPTWKSTWKVTVGNCEGSYQAAWKCQHQPGQLSEFWTRLNASIEDHLNPPDHCCIERVNNKSYTIDLNIIVTKFKETLQWRKKRF